MKTQYGRGMPTPRPLLVVAHPGHELLVHDWMVEHRPVVMILTDGSGSAGAPRIEGSARIVREAGATLGPVFGHAPDAVFYQAILRGDVAFFAALVRAAAAVRAPLVLSDAIEHFNPVHDLAAVIATLAAGDAARWVFPIEVAVDREALPPDWRVRTLDAGARARKRAALAHMPQLEVETARRRDEGKEATGLEILGPLAAGAPLMPAPAGEAFYETFGRRRIAAGAFGELITYAGHVAPLAHALARTVSQAAADAGLGG
jgi:hypothetical protein